MKKWLDIGLNQLQQAKDQVLDQVQKKMPVASSLLGQLPVWVSSETSDFKATKYDEKHYFVVPYPWAENGVALHSMRCLPKGYSELNLLPKRRVFHFANHQAEQLLQQQLAEQLQQKPHQQNNTLIDLADTIDEVDNKLTNGMLLLGGLVFFVNPIAGMGIAAKALLPGIPSLLSKYGIRPLGEKLNQSQLGASLKQAQQKVKQEFASGDTIQLINPVLVELEHNLSSRHSNYDPLLDFDFNQVDFGQDDNGRYLELSCKAISHVYKSHLEQPPAQLSLNTWRWLKLIQQSVDSDT